MNEDLTEVIADGVAVLTLNRPDRLNAISPEMSGALLEALPRLGADPEVRVIVLTGAGRAFSAGGDMKAMAGRTNRTFEQRVEMLRHVHRVPYLLASIPKVVIASINGVAVGAGMGLALACDFRVASRSAKFIPGFTGVALSGDYGGSWTLSRLAGSARAKEIYMLNETLDAQAALADGLVTRVVDDDQLMQATQEMARKFADGPTLTYGYMKRSLLAAETLGFAEALDLEAMHVARTGMSEDHAEALRAFGEKRPPVFTGR